MENALKYFSKKNLLEIDKFEANDLQLRFHELADVLLNQSILIVGNMKYRICEIEFYAYSENHQDPYVHRHPEQLKFGNWYFHQIKTKNGFSYKGGNYKGIDLTLGDNSNFVGVLIRSIESIEMPKRIEGPSLVVDKLLSDLDADSVAELSSSNKSMIALHFDPSLSSREFVMGPRVGLRPISSVENGSRDFMFKPFRYITEPSKAKIGKSFLFLHQVGIYGLKVATGKTGIRQSEAKKYLTWFEFGMGRSLTECNFGKTVKDHCIYFGAVYASHNSTQRTNSSEVAIEELHEMAVEAFKLGDQKQLKYLCDLGIESCGIEGLGLEFLKLRGIMFAKNRELTLARQDFLMVLGVDPSDEMAFINYISACLETGDRSSAITAIKTFYASFNGLSKNLGLESIQEAIKLRTLLVEELPKSVLNDLSKILNSKTVA